MIKHIHILGASGSGTTTLGAALSKDTGYVHFNTDSYYFEKFPQKRNPLSRNSMLDADLRGTESWILTGALCSWGDFTRRFFDLVVFLWVPTEIRLARLQARELRKYGDILLDPDSIEYKRHQMFRQWASAYNAGGYDMQSQKQHERWMSGLSCPVIRLEGDRTLAENMKAVLGFMEAASSVKHY
jgi:adenylate kinase family enzyme